jgi:pimeloyl-ACP methyl ester carboxylesterase
MTPFYFGPPERRLLGLFHPSATAARGERAVLLCNPFGQEAVRSHRVYRVLAERLARSGIPALRFDYHATGDSAGSDEAGDLDGWARDVLSAQRELAAHSGAARIVCVGARLGAALVARAAAAVPDPSTRLVLWDPIVDGADYLRLLRIKHVESLEASYSLPDASWRRRLSDDPAAFSEEAIGFAMSPTLRAQIAHLSPQTLTLPAGTDVHVIAHPADAAVNRWVTALQSGNARVQHRPLTHSFDWTAAEAMNTALVPAPALSQLMSAIGD